MADQVYVRKLTDKNLKRWKVDFPFLTKHPGLIYLKLMINIAEEFNNVLEEPKYIYDKNLNNTYLTN